MNAAYIMADTKMDIDPSGDTHRTGSSAFAPDPFLPGQIPSKCRKKANGGNQGNKSLGRGKLAAPYYFGSCFLGRRENSNKICVFGVPLSRLKQKLSGKKKKTKTDTSKKILLFRRSRQNRKNIPDHIIVKKKEETSVIIKEDTTPVEVEEIEGHRYTPDLLEKEPEDKISEILPEQTDACDERDYRREDGISKEIDTSVSEHKETENKNKNRIKDLILKIAGRIKSVLGNF